MSNTITIQECRYCDHTMSHRPYGNDDVAVCVGCGAEWDPVSVEYDRDELEAELKGDSCSCGAYASHHPGTDGHYGMCDQCFYGDDEEQGGECI